MIEGSPASSETPAEYLNRCKSQFPPKVTDTKWVPPTLVELHNGNEEKARRSLEDLRTRDYAQDLLERLMPGLPEVFPTLVAEGFLAVAEINDPAPNATTARLGERRYAIAFNRGLTKFLYRVTRVLSTRFQPTGSREAPRAVEFEDSCRILSDVFFWFKETGLASGPDYPVTEWQITMASMLATEAESFFLAHELGHVFNDLRAYAANASPAERDAAWGNELEADKFALAALLKSRNRRDSSAPVEISYAGAEAALSTFAGLEALGVEFGNSHPPALERLKAIRKDLNQLCTDEYSREHISAFAKPLDILFLHILDQLKAPDWESFLSRATSEAMRDLEQLLDRCTGGMVPDYVTFRMNVHDLLDRLASPRLYERVARAAAEFAHHLKTIEQAQDTTAKRQAWISFQKYKLFMSMIRDTHDPFRSLFEEALQLPPS